MAPFCGSAKQACLPTGRQACFALALKNGSENWFIKVVFPTCLAPRRTNGLCSGVFFIFQDVVMQFDISLTVVFGCLSLGVESHFFCNILAYNFNYSCVVLPHKWLSPHFVPLKYGILKCGKQAALEQLYLSCSILRPVRGWKWIWPTAKATHSFILSKVYKIAKKSHRDK